MGLIKKVLFILVIILIYLFFSGKLGSDDLLSDTTNQTINESNFTLIGKPKLEVSCTKDIDCNSFIKCKYPLIKCVCKLDTGECYEKN